MSLNPNKGVLKLFAAGGTGVSIAHALESQRGQNELGFANLEITYIDTSRSDLRAGIDPKHVYLFPETDGSGQVRAENHPLIKESIRDILQKHQPGDINVVLSSGGGGSGSVIAPLLVAELLTRDIPVIAICVGSADTRKEAENTINTLKSYENIAQNITKTPVVMYYAQNGGTTSRSQVDKLVQDMVVSLCALYSRENHGLDSRDLYNFLHFDKVTSFAPCLATLSLVDPKSDISDIGHVLTVATLAKSGEETAFEIMPEFQVRGIVSPQTSELVRSRTPVHFVVSDGTLAKAAGSIQSLLKEVEQRNQARLRRTSLVGNNDQAADGGLIL